ncbi:MAG: glycoside hydrolase family 65 protein, partial [Candidatus Omnitrophica bacterium]|nr:glycoside hydrolase family 65 protein [Candidatus Omnitrophota bacterium]MBD3268966.1 glycoside hydrolase family 65 protein [Candidatus Omnitrophota bacterium]
ILKAEGKSPDAYKVAKQADVLMAFYLLSFSELEDIFKRLGYPFDKQILRKNYQYYIKRTSHGSTLSKVTHCYIALILNKPKEAWRMFKDVLESDIYDVQGGTTPEGIHVGVMGGSVGILTRGFCGLDFTENKIILNPHLPKEWEKVKFKVLYKNIWFTFSFSRNSVSVLTEGQISLPIEVEGTSYYPSLGKKLTIPIP